ncbi:helix-turn-helix domain-containing protein [Flavivirga algicola]|uniref:Helix-turn-helix transcriptional regulator n=1 Tax=Flavivirga algicola TaxID=2729136 RepID=A0ABX1RU46_9FLAO|nr:AraC family transcriptional regulator [Flavivirga algicola]NMH86019.1 helix-turn-helix transcriptional regulator [Flavivirga algicola]
MNELLPFLKLSMLHAGYAKLDDNWCYKNVISPFVRLFLVTKGGAKAYYTNQSFDLKKGYMYLIPSFTYNSYSCDMYHEQYYTGFFEEIKLGMSVFNIKRFEYEVEASAADYDLFKRLIEINPNKSVLESNPQAHINNTLSNYNNPESIALSHDIETQGILSILLSRFIKSSDVFSNKGSFKGDLNKVLVYIAKHLDEEITVSHLAEYCNLSSDHFSRSFYAKFNIKPSKYIQLKRVERAQFLLLSTSDSLKQIAEKVGLNNLSYFSRKFTEITGVSPAKFRKQQLNL